MKLIEYLPPFMRGFEELSKVLEAQQPELEILRGALGQVQDNLYVATADGAGLRLFERMVGVYVSSSDDIDTRRKRILVKINDFPPYTMRTLLEQLELACGAGNCSAEIDGFRLEVRLSNMDYRTYLDVREILVRMVPANLVVVTITQQDLPDVHVQVGCPGVAVFYKRVLDWESFMYSGVSAEISGGGVLGVYRRTQI